MTDLAIIPPWTSPSAPAVSVLLAGQGDTLTWRAAQR